MAKKQSSAGLFERAGYAYSASNLTMKHHDYIKSLKDDLVISERKSEEVKNDPVDQMQDQQTTDYILQAKDQIDALNKIKPNATNPETGLSYTKEEIESANKSKNEIEGGIFDHHRHIKKEQENQELIKTRLDVPGGIHAAMGKEMQKNAHDYAAQTLPRKFNPSTNQFEYLDYTTRFENDKGEFEYEYKPSNQLNMGAPIDTENGLGSIFAKHENMIFDIAKRRDVKKNPDFEWGNYQKQFLTQVERRLKSHPNEANNLLFTEDDFEPVLENLIFEGYFMKQPQFAKLGFEGKFNKWNQWKQSIAYDAAVEDLKNQQMSPDFIIEEYGKILNAQFQDLQPKETEQKDYYSLIGNTKD